MTRALSSLLIALTVLCVGPQAVWAAPQGAQVVSGQVQLSQQGSVTTIRASNNSIINYKSFDIARPETVQFVQPGAAARVLNRIQGLDPTHINGSLLANGRVYIVNPAGVYFGKDAVVNVGALVAAAGSISNQDFQKGIDHFTGVKGQVINLGSIKGDIVALLGREVANRGSITSHDGLIALVAGNDVLLVPSDGHLRVHISGGSEAAAGPDAPGVENSGRIDAGEGEVNLSAGDVYSLAIRQTPDGSITAHDIAVEGGQGGAVQVSGTLDASNPGPGGSGGRISVLGDAVALSGARLDASGDGGGGSVLVGGDLHGGGGIQTASTTTVSGDSSIHADAVAKGDGGKIVVWSEKGTQFAGRISARGGAQGGNGGFAEVSGKAWLAYQGLVDLTAPQGTTGTLLLDPDNITIQSGGTDTIPGAPPQLGFSDAPATASIDAATVVSALDGANVLLQATNDITVSQGIDSSQNANAGDLTLEAGHNILLDAFINLNGSFTAISNSPSSPVSPTTPGVTIFGSSGGSNGAVQTTGSQQYVGDVELNLSSGAVGLKSTGNGSVDFEGAVTGPSGLAVDTNGNTTFEDSLGGTTPGQALASLLMAGTGSTIFGNGGASPLTVNTSGTQTYAGGVQVNLSGAGATLASTGTGVNGAITFNEPVVGPGGLTVTTAGGTRFQLQASVGGGVVGGSFVGGPPLAFLRTDGGGTTTFDLPTNSFVTTGPSGSQVYDDDVVLSRDTIFRSLDPNTLNPGNGAITFNGTVDGPGALTVDTAGDTTFRGDVGGTTALGSLSVAPNGLLAGNTIFDNSVQPTLSVRTGGGQTYGDGVRFLADTTLVSVATQPGPPGGAIQFLDAVDGPGALTTDTAFDTTFQGDVGGTTPLTSITTNPKGYLTGRTLLGDGSTTPGLTVTTTGDQTYGDDVELQVLGGAGPPGVPADVMLVSTGGGNITFQGTVDGLTVGMQGLGVDTAGDTAFWRGVGGSVALRSLATDSGGRTLFGDGSTTPGITVTTTGDQTYGDNVELHAPGSTTLQTILPQLPSLVGNGMIKFEGRVDGLVPGGQGLIVTTSGDTAFEKDVGGSVPLLSILTNGYGSTLFGTSAQAPITITTTTSTTPTIDSQSYDDSVVLNADAWVRSVDPGNPSISGQGTIEFYNVVNAQSPGGEGLRVTTGGGTEFLGAVGGTSPLGFVQTDGGGTTYLQGGSVATMARTTPTARTDYQLYQDDVFLGPLGQKTTLTSIDAANPNGIGAGKITFQGLVDGDLPGLQDLTVATTGDTAFRRDVGGSVALRSLTTDSGGRTLFGDGSTTPSVTVTTTGDQTYGDDVELDVVGAAGPPAVLPEVTLASTGGGNITFGGLVDGPGGLTVSGKDVTFRRPLGENSALADLSVGGTNSIFDNSLQPTLAATTVGTQLYYAPVQLKANTTLTSSGKSTQGDIRFFGGVDGPGALTVTTAGDTDFLRNLGSPNPLLPVGGTTPLASLLTNGGGTTYVGGGSVTTQGAQTYGDALQLGIDATLTSKQGGLIAFDGSVEGPGGLDVEGPGSSVFFGGDVGMNAPLAFLTVNVGSGAAPRIGFVSPSPTQTVNAWGDIGLNPNGRSTAPSLVATIFRRREDPITHAVVAGDLAIDSVVGNIEVGRNELFGAVGNLSFATIGGDVTTGALSALDLTISGNRFLIQPQSSGVTNIIGNTIQVNATPGTSPSNRNNRVEFATPSGGVEKDVSTNVVTTTPGFLVRAIYEDGKTGLEPSALLQGTTVISVEPGGPAPGNQNSTVSAPAPVLPTKPFGGVNQIAVSERPLRASEVSAFLECDSHDSFCQDQAVGSVRAKSAEAKKLRESFDAVFGKVTPKRNPRREALQSAVDAYRKQFGKAPIGGVEFRQFLESDKEYAPALQVLNHLGTLFVNAREFGMTGQGLGDFEQRTLQDIVPAGITVGQLEKAIEAGKLQRQARATASRPTSAGRARRAG